MPWLYKTIYIYIYLCVCVRACCEARDVKNVSQKYNIPGPKKECLTNPIYSLLFYKQLREFPENLSFTVAERAIYSCTFVCIMKLHVSYFRLQANTMHALSWIKFILFFKKKSCLFICYSEM